VREVQFYERDVRFRLPFRFGVITLTEEPEVLVRVRIETESGSLAWGIAAEALAPKWFDKNPTLSNEDNFGQLRQALNTAAQFYLASGFRRPFDLFADNYPLQLQTCRNAGLNHLIAGYGPALLDRAILDACCRNLDVSFYEAIRGNLPGMHSIRATPELEALSFDPFLASLRPSQSLYARHTVGLVDPITPADQSESSRVHDGLPETLDEIIGSYGTVYFKVKVSGDLTNDLYRLRRIAAILDQLNAPYFLTLDGNEQYRTGAEVEELWIRMVEDTRLERFVQSTLFLEQPLKREYAFDQDLGHLKDRIPVIIDESDQDLDSFPTAIRFGYRGVSSKQCKGIYRSLINLARSRLWNQREGTEHFFLSGEDLTTQVGVNVQQDLALVSILGLTHLERNGYHYVAGMSGLSGREQRAFLSAHPDLYTRDDKLARIAIRGGRMQIGSLACAGFATSVQPDWSSMRRLR
jgi:hypothetical protein